MIRRIFSLILALGALASPAAVKAQAKDELVVAMTQMPGTWNPIISSMLAKSLIANMTARPVTAYDADWKLVCLVCTELPTIENGKARVVDLADGKKGMEIDVELRDMRWGDGTPVSAKDVAFTLEVGKHPLSGVASSEGYKRIIKLDVKDDRRFTMTIDRVTFDYNSIGLQLLPAHIEKPIFDANPAEYRNRTAYDTQSTNPGLAFGPYRLTEIVPGSRVVLEPNPTWTGQKPSFKRITVRIIENTAALEANLLSGSVDYVLGELGLSLDQAIAFEKRHKDKYNVVYKPALIWEHIDVNLDNKLLTDRRVRQAMLLAIDRKAISEKLFEGKQPIAHGGISELDPMFSPAARQYGYDPAAARKLLDEAGFSTIRNNVRHNAAGEKLSIELGTTAGNRVRELVAQVIQSQLRQVGIEVRLKAETPRIFFDAMGKRTYSGLGMYAWVQRPEGVPRSSLHSKEIPSADNGWSGQNYPGYANPEMDKVLDAAERELDVVKRRALFAEIQKLAADDLPSLPLFFRVDPFVIPKPLKGVTPTGTLNSSTLWVEQWRWEN
ncbi:peptide ABC transporter substrate-binding protein [Reyranella sp. MMS21-HV4-11]|uniref:Peptide ABC transporter substrate-binding protein n=1 Tax=Reyranella humidisoli TaxID=2849149 RepID=A0ABS6IL16_9HYPH|nr:peptide ABC transporter substrate-binding protein [Reyranella sp. MMS21-HV4-11]MBU8875291.1 peptide ABC transporter substrate-binding protein [Reyranella sp. MMS21-HV4-11]